MLKGPPSGVLASLRDSTYRSVRLASSLAAAWLVGLFEHPAAYEAKPEHFRRTACAGRSVRMECFCVVRSGQACPVLCHEFHSSENATAA